MKAYKNNLFLVIVTVILSSFILLVSCTSGTGTATDEPEPTNTGDTTTAQTEPTVTPMDTPATTTFTTTTSAKTTAALTNTTPTTTTTATTVEPEIVFTPVVGVEYPNWIIMYDYDKWTVLEFDYDVIHKPGDDYHFPWSLTIKNKTENDLELTAYIIHWGYHNSIGYISKKPFLLKAGETQSLSGEDILSEIFYQNMIYLEDVQIEVYVAEG